MYYILLFVFLFCGHLEGALSLRDNLQKAQPGDFIVTSQNKNYTLIHIYSKQGEFLTLEEITIPARFASQSFAWRDWLRQGAPYNTSWVLHTMHLPTGRLQHSYSVSQKAWLDTTQGNNFLAQLMNLQLFQIPDKERKRVGIANLSGPIDRRPFWQPKMIVDNQTLPDVAFSAWRGRWPKDGSPISNKFIEIYLPEDGQYPNYLPYWLQVRGMSGSKVTVHVIDSGRNMASPALFPQTPIADKGKS